MSFVSAFSPWQLQGVRKPHVLLEMAQYHFRFLCHLKEAETLQVVTLLS